MIIIITKVITLCILDPILNAQVRTPASSRKKNVKIKPLFHFLSNYSFSRLPSFPQHQSEEGKNAARISKNCDKREAKKRGNRCAEAVED